MAIKNTLRDIRFDMKMDQNDFADFLGVSRTLYNRWERNNAQPSLEWAIKISNKTNRPIQDFIQVDPLE